MNGEVTDANQQEAIASRYIIHMAGQALLTAGCKIVSRVCKLR